MASDPGFDEADLALLGRVADRVVALRLEVPAILALESARPLSLVAGQSMIFFEPLVQAMFRIADYRRFATLIERRDTMERLVGLIDERAVAARAGRRAARGTGES
jgi:hypothetical protein